MVHRVSEDYGSSSRLAAPTGCKFVSCRCLDVSWFLGCGQVSSREPEDSDCGMDTETAQNGAQDVWSVDEDEDDSEDKKINDYVDYHTANNRFLAFGKWTISYKPFDRPGDGYWVDDHGDDPPVQSFSSSVTAGLINAKQRPAPKYISRNPFCFGVPKNRFHQQVLAYHRCKKVLLSADGKEVFRATDQEIEAALKKDGRESVTADFYVKAVSEALRRHRNALRK
ncbi:unnamed protein product [Pylaiella littoralis]